MQANSPLLTPGTLIDRICQQTEYALNCGALHPILTDYEIIEEEGIPFLVRIVSNLARKEAQKRKSQNSALSKKNKNINPFLPCDRDLLIGDLSASHRCVLNKYNVVNHHILIVTRQFESQENWLTLADFHALWLALAEIDGLGFYNGGTNAGASQPHKHLQVVPLPLIPQGISIPIEKALEDKLEEIKSGDKGDTLSMQERLYQSPKLPFRHGVAFFDPQMIDPQKAAQISLNNYYQLLQKMGQLGEEKPGIQQTGAYNLLVTRRWMMIIPRSQESWESISVNSLGFAGALLVRDSQQLEQLKALGLMNLLKHVAAK